MKAGCYALLQLGLSFFFFLLWINRKARIMFQMSCKEHFHNPEAVKTNKQKTTCSTGSMWWLCGTQAIEISVCVCVWQLKLKQAVLPSVNPFYATVPSLADFSSQAELNHMAWDKECLDRYEKTCLSDAMKQSLFCRVRARIRSD